MREGQRFVIHPDDSAQGWRVAANCRDAIRRHIAALQLDVIERGIELWSRPGDLVFSPFAGIGSEGYVAVQMNRRFVGAELKRSYFEVASKNLEQARLDQGDLLSTEAA